MAITPLTDLAILRAIEERGDYATLHAIARNLGCGVFDAAYQDKVNALQAQGLIERFHNPECLFTCHRLTESGRARLEEG